jgi:hypothetical protein
VSNLVRNMSCELLIYYSFSNVVLVHVNWGKLSNIYFNKTTIDQCSMISVCEGKVAYTMCASTARLGKKSMQLRDELIDLCLCDP